MFTKSELPLNDFLMSLIFFSCFGFGYFVSSVLLIVSALFVSDVAILLSRFEVKFLRCLYSFSYWSKDLGDLLYLFLLIISSILVQSLGIKLRNE